MRSPVLLVDSYDHSRTALADLLRRRGYPVREARNGVEALSCVRERLPGMVVLDLWPFFSASVQMLERLRRTPGAEEIPVLVVTSPVWPEYRARALAAGCQGYLEKPCTPDRVLAEIRRLLPIDPSVSAAGSEFHPTIPAPAEG